MAKHWDSVAENYDELVGSSGDAYHRAYINPVVLKLLGDVKGKSVLDLGCGQGYFATILHKKGAKVTGVDYSDKLLKIAKEKNPGKTKKIEYFSGDSAKLSMLKNGSFDIVVSNVAFHDIKNIKGTIKECARVLMVGGKLIFSIPHPWTQIGNSSKDEDGYFRIVRGYLTPRVKENYIYNEIEAYHRSIDFYANELFKNNLFISALQEISASKHSGGGALDNPEKSLYKKEIPSFLIMEGTRVK